MWEKLEEICHFFHFRQKLGSYIKKIFYDFKDHRKLWHTNEKIFLAHTFLISPRYEILALQPMALFGQTIAVINDARELLKMYKNCICSTEY